MRPSGCTNSGSKTNALVPRTCFDEKIEEMCKEKSQGNAVVNNKVTYTV